MPIDYSNALYIVYNGYDNAIEYILKVDNVAQDISELTQVKLIEEDEEFTIDSDVSADAFAWDSETTGLLQMKLGHEDVGAGVYNCWLVVYDLSNPNGIVWGSLVLEFVDI